MLKDDIKKKYGDWTLITGASSGVGRAFAEFLAECGLNCILISNDLPNLIIVSKEIEKKYKVQTYLLEADLSTIEGVKLVKNIPGLEPRLIVNSAAYGLMGYFIQHEVEDYMNMMDLNDKAIVSITHHYCREFYKSNQKGAIINVSSANAEFRSPIPFSSVYSAGKSFMKFFTEAVAFEMKPYGIDILNVSCGPTDTNFQMTAETNRLSNVEKPQNVPIKAFEKLGDTFSVTTNQDTKKKIKLFRILPFSENRKISMLAKFFREELGKKENANLKQLFPNRKQVEFNESKLYTILSKLGPKKL